MDGLSAAASIIAVVEITMEDFDLCNRYYVEVKEARADIERLRLEILSFQSVLLSVRDLAENPSSAELSTLRNLCNSGQDGIVQRCTDDLEGLREKLESKPGKDQMRKFGFRALKWHFSSKEVEKLITTLERFKAMFSLALDADQV
jgi:hypothetical protein